ncbi:MAG: hypothetical protein U0166_07225 [Acidobacteriota bacterium]
MKLRVGGLVKGGYAVARSPSGTVLVTGALPGEEVTARPAGRHGGAALARCVRVIEASPERRDAPCPMYDECGGCDLQHARYEAQVAYKRGILEDCLRRLGKLAEWPAIAVVPSPELGYRRRVRLHVSPGAGSIALGYYRRGSRAVAPLGGPCPILTPVLAGLVEGIRRDEHALLDRCGEITLLEGDGAHSAVVRVSGRGAPQRRAIASWLEPLGVADLAVVGDGEEIEAHAGGVPIRAGQATVWASARCFFQGNAPLLEALASEALRSAPERPFRLWDLHAGVGLFSAAVGARAREIACVEADPQAIPLLTRNAGGRRARIFEGTDAAFLRRHEPAPDLCIVDPPRSGLTRDVREDLARVHPPLVTIVGCDPAALATDAGALIRSGYRLTSIAMLDLFPQSAHVEAVLHLEAV